MGCLVGAVLAEVEATCCFSFLRGSMKIDTAGSQDVYFVAPAKYLGDKRFAYTLTLSFQLQQDNASLPASSSEGDVVLEGKWFPQPLVTSLRPPPPSGNRFQKYQVRVTKKLGTNKAVAIGNQFVEATVTY